jgi:hypothetical protein
MKTHVFMRPSEYSNSGWKYEFAYDEQNSKFMLDHMGYIYLGTIRLPDPKLSTLVDMGLAHVEEMKKNAAEQIMNDKQAIAEYESKFIMLEAPDKEELA